MFINLKLVVIVESPKAQGSIDFKSRANKTIKPKKEKQEKTKENKGPTKKKLRKMQLWFLFSC